MLPARYKPITRTVLAGGFGNVTPVEDTFLRRVVMYKSMQNAADHDQLLNEINGLSRARSRHVVEIYDVIKDGNGRVEGVIIERLRGRDYANFHAEAQGAPGEYLKVLYQVGTALRDIHAVGVVHRDLKVDNFKASAAGIVKLFDFGISSPDGGYHTKNNRGTLVYAAPELYLPGAVITREMDVYAFGVCAWLLATSAPPAVMLERPPQQSALCPSLATVMGNQLHTEVIQLLDRCVSPMPADRPTAAQLGAVLARHLVRDRHRGLFVRNNIEMIELSAAQPGMRMRIPDRGELRVSYDGLSFRIVEVHGNVYVNNQAAQAGMFLHDACLLTFGDTALGGRREWVTFFCSHPEVVL